MTSRLYDSTYLDLNGNKIIWGDNINSILFYRAGDESWDRTGGGTTSWYLENTLPYDSFYGDTLSSERWSYFDYRGTISGSVDSRLKLEVNEAEARGGITSSNLWKLSGDFDIKVYLDETSYYNEYRGNVSSGLTLSIDSSNKYRVAKHWDGTTLGYKSTYVLDSELKYFGWTDNGTIDSTVGEDSVTCLRIVREGDVVSSYASTSSGFSQVGSSVSGTVWGQDADVEIEIETEQYNTYKIDFLGFTASGTLDQTLSFSSGYRGGSGEFPERSLIVADDLGLSVINEEDKSLWMRFVSGSANMFRNTSARLSATEGKIYYSSTQGVFCLDLVQDRAINYQAGQTFQSISNIAARNYGTSFYYSSANTFVPNNAVLDLSAKKIDGVEYLSVATVSGIGLLVNDESKSESVSSGNVQRTYISDDGKLYWNEYSDTTGTGALYYREGIAGLLGGSDTFSFTSFYDTFSAVSISSEDINDIYVDTSSGHKLILAHSCGIDYINGLSSIKYGPDEVESSVQDPGFSSYLGIYWNVFDSSSASDLSISGAPPVGVFPAIQAAISTDWFTLGSSSLKLLCGSGRMVISGDYRGVYQQLDFTSINKIYFDSRLVNELDVYYTNYFDLEVLIGNTVVATFSDTEETYTSLNNVIDVSGYTGVDILVFRMKAKYTGDAYTTNYFYVDNIRITQITPDYSIIDVEDHNILEAIILYGVVDKKIFFANSEGFGSIDLVTNTMDFFNRIEDLVSLSTIISSEYVEVIDEV